MKKFIAILLSLTMIPAALTVGGTLGDGDSDSIITANDAAIAIQATLNDQYIADLDVNADGRLNSEDAAIILQKALDSSYIMPGEEGTTESSTEATTEETTEESTGWIGSDYELTPANFSEDEYFEEIGTPTSSTNSEKIRLYGQNSLKFRVNANANIYITAKHASNNTSAANRDLTLSTANGTYITSHEYKQGGNPTEILYATVGRGAYVITASDHMNIYSVRVVLSEVDPDLEISTEIETSTETTTSETSTKDNTPTTMIEVPSEITTTGNKVEVSNFAQLNSALTKTNTDIYVTDDISCTAQLALSISNANINIIGVTKPDGTSPVLDFAKFRDSASNSGEGRAGFLVKGSHYSFENLIIQKAPDCGMRIKGTNAGYVFIKDCIFRYNNNSGISVTSGGNNNTFIGVDSYRNGDIVSKCGDDADGFSVKLQAGENNYFYNCRAYDNSDDGWDSYDRGTPYVGNIYYIECLAWNNGNPETFTGEYDYKMGYPLDKDLLYIEAVLADNPGFETEYNNRTVSSWPEATIHLYNKTRTYAELHSELWGGNPNGFKFGSAETPSSSYRYVENCIAFDHFANIHQSSAKGYDQNNGSESFDIVNGLSFDNVLNYETGKMTALSQKGEAWGFGGSKSDSTKNLKITTPDKQTQETLRNKVHQYRSEILDSVNANIIPGIKICDVFNG